MGPALSCEILWVIRFFWWKIVHRICSEEIIYWLEVRSGDSTPQFFTLPEVGCRDSGVALLRGRLLFLVLVLPCALSASLCCWDHHTLERCLLLRISTSIMVNIPIAGGSTDIHISWFHGWTNLQLSAIEANPGITPVGFSLCHENSGSPRVINPFYTCI